ncbi:MAG: LytTR family DNA-binding domain-containing protein [Bacteroidota bacterium]
MKALIIDDEAKARNLLRVLIQENCPKITQIYQAERLMQGVTIIQQQAPEVVFLDIEMPDRSGLEILDFIDKEVQNFEIIFTTAYRKYALEAFQLAAIDYLLKPLGPDQVRNAVNKAIAFIGSSKMHEKLDALKTFLQQQRFEKIALPVYDGIEFVPFDQIVMLKADSMYTQFFLKEGKTITISKPLKHFVGILRKVPSFYRPHRSYLINLLHLKKYVKSDGGYIQMEGELTAAISREKKEEFLALIQQL